MYWISGLEKGRLTTMPKPDGGDFLLPTLQGWKNAGTDVIVSLLTDSEIETAVLQQEQALCQQIGLRFLNFPIQDFGVPNDTQAAISLVSILSKMISEGKSIAIHCWAGIGRSTTIVAAILIEQGFTPQTVFDVISQARGQLVPDTKAQKQWVWSTMAKNHFRDE